MCRGLHVFRKNFRWFGVFLGACLAAENGFSATTVPSVLTGTVVWEASGNPYLLQGDTRLAPGSVLICRPGVEIRVPVRQDESIPRASEKVDFILQGRLEIEGMPADPVRIVPENKTGRFGVLYVLQSPEKPWRSLHVTGGKVFLSRCAVRWNDGRVVQGGGVALGPSARLQAEDCQFDENETGLDFLAEDAEADLSRTRLWKNRMGLVFRAPARLSAKESAVLDSTKYAAVFLKPGEYRLPELWWGTTRTEAIQKSFYRAKGSSVFFQPFSTVDPFVTRVTGFTPKKEYLQRLDPWPKYSLGLEAGLVFPSLNKIPQTDFRSTLSIGVAGTYRFQNMLEGVVRLGLMELSSSNPAAKNSTSLSLLQGGVFLKNRFWIFRKEKDEEKNATPAPPEEEGPAKWPGRIAVTLEGGGWLTQAKLTVTRPQVPSNPSTPLETKASTEMNFNPHLGAGVSFPVAGRHTVQIGAAYQTVILGDGRSGFLLSFSGAFRYYF